jgi:hypothetical protein
MANRNYSDMQALPKEVKTLFGKATYTAGVAATATLNLTNDIVLTKVALAADTGTFKTIVNAAAANPTNKVLIAFTGTAAAIICTVTPNDGTNNSATPVALTTAELREMITTGLVSGKSLTITDASALRALQTATGGGAAALTAGGEGDDVTATFASGVTASFALATGYLGITSVTQVANSTYRITLQDNYYSLLGINVISLFATEVAHTFQLKSESVSSGTLDIILQSSDVNLTNAEVIFFTIFVKNTSVI